MGSSKRVDRRRTTRKGASKPPRRSLLPESLLADLPGYVYRVRNDPDYTPTFISAGHSFCLSPAQCWCNRTW